MSAPASAPSPATPAAARPRVTVGMRVIAAAAFVALGFVAVWQGFGLAGFGTDVHFTRAVTACIPLFAFGLVFLQPRWIAARALVAVIGLGVAGWLWWIAESSNLKSAVSLRDAVTRRNEYKTTTAQPTIEDWEKHAAAREIGHLFEQWPSLMGELKDDYERWTAGVADDVVSRYDKTPPGDLVAIERLKSSTKQFLERHSTKKEQAEAAFRKWLARAIKAKDDELRPLLGDGTAFDSTAPGRHALAAAFPESRLELIRIEADWVTRWVSILVLVPPVEQDTPLKDVNWVPIEQSVRALKSLDTSDGRFKEARGLLFNVAHESAQRAVTAHIEAKRYELAHGLARKHAVDWNATATMLGPDEVKKLDALRETGAALDKLASKAAKPPAPADIAPEPRPKP